MTAPTIYFPTGLVYKLGFEHDRLWNTEVSPRGPSGRTQRFKNWDLPVRRMQLTVLGLGGSGSLSETANKSMRQFLFSIAGRYTPFYIFNPRAGTYDAGLDPQQTYVGLFNTSFPMVCPFKGGTITTIYKNGVSYRTTGHFTQDSGGTGGETRIASVEAPLPSDGDIITVDVTLCNERIPVRSANDVDATRFDWSAAQPPTEYALELEEDFG